MSEAIARRSPARPGVAGTDSRARSTSPRRDHVRASARSCRPASVAGDDAGIPHRPRSRQQGSALPGRSAPRSKRSSPSCASEYQPLEPSQPAAPNDGQDGVGCRPNDRHRRIASQLQRLHVYPALGQGRPRVIKVVPAPLELNTVEVGRDRNPGASPSGAIARPLTPGRRRGRRAGAEGARRCVARAS